MRFTEFLTETERPKFITDPNKIREHIDRYRNQKMTGTNVDYFPEQSYEIIDGIVHVDSIFNITITPEFLIDGFLPFKFKEIGNLNLNTTELKSYIGMPDKINHNLYIHGHGAPKSLEGFPAFVSKEIDINVDKKVQFSFEGIHNHLKEMNGGNIYLPKGYAYGLLGFLKVQNVSKLYSLLTKSAETRLNRALIIINKHLTGDKDLIDCKRELVSNELKEFAKL